MTNNNDSFDLPEMDIATMMQVAEETAGVGLAAQLTEAAQRLSEMQIDFQVKEIELKKLKEDIRNMEEDKLPSMMQELQMQELVLENGWRLKLVEKVTASITEEKRSTAMNWLVAHDFGGIIKTEVKMSFDRGAIEDARKVAAELSEEYPENQVEAKETVHPMTLTSFVKEQLGKGAELPLDIFSVHVINKVEIKKGKK